MSRASQDRWIHKTPGTFRVPPNMPDYEETRRSFSWSAIDSELRGSGGTANIGRLAVDRHVAAGRGAHEAIHWIVKDGSEQSWSFHKLLSHSNRFANLLRRIGIGKGERVFALLGRTPDTHIAALGALKNGCVFCPLFSAFGPEPIRQRLSLGGARVLVTTTRLYEKKVAPLRNDLPQLVHVILTDSEDESTGVLSLSRQMASVPEEFVHPETDPEDPALLHFTSGTTGKPKGALHVHKAALMHYMTGKYVLDFHPNDIFWCTADPGWVTGTSYGIIAPLLHGVSSVVDEGDFDPERWFSVLEKQRVSVWYTAPTAIRMLMRSGIEPRRRFDLRHLRFVASVGEPLNAEAVIWGQEALGLPIHDNWWQTETGGIMIANFLATDIRPGSMGLPLPGVQAAVVQRTDDGPPVVAAIGAEGELALKPGWPSMFRSYLHEEARYQKCFANGWYLTGDLVRQDADGYFWFLGRADDVIKTAGHMVGPFEVESVLMSHPAVSEAGVIGKPDPVIGEIVKAFVTLKPGVPADETTRLDLIGFARQRLGSAVSPKEIEFRDRLPHTRSAKIMRRLLKARELGLAEGDTSTLEGTE